MNIWPFVSPMCTGPAEVPMMSPNGSIPPIHVPPGYISQVSATFQDNIINKYVFGKGNILYVFYYFYYSLSIWKEGIKKTIIDSQWKSGTTCHMSILFTLHLNDTRHYKLVVTWACACKCACGTASIFWGKKKKSDCNADWTDHLPSSYLCKWDLWSFQGSYFSIMIH